MQGWSWPWKWSYPEIWANLALSSTNKQVESEEKVKINQTLPEVNVKERILDLKKSMFGNKHSSSEYYTDSKYTSIPKNRLVNIQTSSQSPLKKTPG